MKTITTIIYMLVLLSTSKGQEFRFQQNKIDKTETDISDNYGNNVGKLKIDLFDKNNIIYFNSKGEVVSSIKKGFNQFDIYNQIGMVIGTIKSDAFNKNNMVVYNQFGKKLYSIEQDVFDKSVTKIIDNSGSIIQTIKPNIFDKKTLEVYDNTSNSANSGILNSGASVTNSMMTAINMKNEREFREQERILIEKEREQLKQEREQDIYNARAMKVAELTDINFSKLYNTGNYQVDLITWKQLDNLSKTYFNLCKDLNFDFYGNLYKDLNKLNRTLLYVNNDCATIDDRISKVNEVYKNSINIFELKNAIIQSIISKYSQNEKEWKLDMNYKDENPFEILSNADKLSNYIIKKPAY